MKVRRDLTKSFYELWKPIFYKAAELRPRDIPVPVRMFLYFGFADEGLAGMENAVLMYKLAENMKDTSEYGVYTAFDWLKAIYSGHKMPSRDEFDEDYTTSMNKKKAQHEITDEEYKKLMNDNTAKVEFEMDNMFKAGNKVSFGRISTYCPVFTGDALLKDLNESLVTLTSVTKVFNHIRKIDFTAFYSLYTGFYMYFSFFTSILHLFWLILSFFRNIKNPENDNSGFSERLGDGIKIEFERTFPAPDFFSFLCLLKYFFLFVQGA